MNGRDVQCESQNTTENNAGVVHRLSSRGQVRREAQDRRTTQEQQQTSIITTASLHPSSIHPAHSHEQRPGNADQIRSPADRTGHVERTGLEVHVRVVAEDSATGDGDDVGEVEGDGR